MIARIKEWLGCKLGFHRWGPWTWDDLEGVRIPPGSSIVQPIQRRACRDCLKKQGPLVSSEERRYYESWRDR